MAKRAILDYSEQFAFYEQLWYFYDMARGKIRSRYNPLTKKFLDYNDREKNPNAFLRKPQFQALEMYVFIKEFLDNRQLLDIFNMWVKKEGDFSDASYYAKGRLGLFDGHIAAQTQTLFKQMERYKTDYPNYIYALTMGLGKTILMATCIFYEFLLSNKYPADKRFCQNVLVFAPEKTVLQSLKEIVTFDKTKVVPPEYATVLDANIKVHFLLETSTSLNTIDKSTFNIIISNAQKIIVRQKHVAATAADKLFQPSLLSGVYDDDELIGTEDLLVNERFRKLCRLQQIGVYVDEAHHLFGNKLEDSLYKDTETDTNTSLRRTINILASQLKEKGTSVVACYNYTGTPYVKRQVLPEVVYAYGLRESIQAGYLKDADVKGFANVKNEEFLRAIINGHTDEQGNKIPGFLAIHGKKTYEGLLPKLAIYAADIDEIRTVVKPILEKILAENNISTSKILVNVGDGNPDLTKDEDIRFFNDLDVPGSEGNKKQFILLCEKGKEGWDCRSLFGVALFRDSFSTVFVLQSTMRCLRQINQDNAAPGQQTANVYLSKYNYDILDAELNKNFNMSIKELSNGPKKNKKRYEVRVIPPEQQITIKEKRYNYSIKKRDLIKPVDFGLEKVDVAKYQITVTDKSSLSKTMKDKQTVAVDVADKKVFTPFSVIGEIAKYFPDAGPLRIDAILENSIDGIEKIVEKVNAYNEILYDEVIPKIFAALYEITGSSTETKRNIILLKTPGGDGFFEFLADPSMVIEVGDKRYATVVKKSFHADTYCFDSNPELECFKQFIWNENVETVYFTGMFTSKGQSELAIPYIDPESQRLRNYYPDFIVKMKDGSTQIIEVKGDNKLEDSVVKAKSEAAAAMAADSNMVYKMLAGSEIMTPDLYPQDWQEDLLIAAERPSQYED
ncbi:MAG: DEAD/DEAH box helicase family protein [Prevotellaceae bacterium]|jgi:hypothetical protein|nr:DEAD/DEAH box helicase family protein [Prevotellaceae bacterium]